MKHTILYGTAILLAGLATIGCPTETEDPPDTGDITYTVTGGPSLIFRFSRAVSLYDSDLIITPETGDIWEIDNPDPSQPGAGQIDPGAGEVSRAGRFAGNDTGKTWKQALSVRKSGRIRVMIRKAGIDPAERFVTVHGDTRSYEVEADGAYGTADSTCITFIFQEPVSLRPEHISLDPYSGSVTATTLTSPDGGLTWKQGITVVQPGTILVKILWRDAEIEKPFVKPLHVHKANPPEPVWVSDKTPGVYIGNSRTPEPGTESYSLAEAFENYIIPQSPPPTPTMNYTIVLGTNDTVLGNNDTVPPPTPLPRIPAGYNITLMGAQGRGEISLTLTGTGTLFTVQSGGTLTLGPGITLKGTAANTRDYLVQVSDGGQFTMQSGSKITGNPTAAVYVAPTGNFTMRGGAISGNSRGVHVSGTFTMRGGSISDNETGVDVPSSTSTFILNGGVISGNSAQGVSVFSGGKFTMAGGSIADNTGSGVYLGNSAPGGEFKMSGGAISGNAAADGSAVYAKLNSNSRFEMSGGYIFGNTATATTGSAVSIASGNTFEMTGGSIADNTGSGISSAGRFIMKGGVVLGNTALGVSAARSGTFEMLNGYIFGNAGSGVSVAGEFIISDGAISNNNRSQKAEKGGGVCTESGSTFKMSGGKISGNKAKQGGGVYAGGVYILAGRGVIYDNTAEEGGGVYAAGTADFTMGGNGTISRNTVSEYGGGLYVDGGSFRKSGGTIIGYPGVRVSENGYDSSDSNRVIKDLEVYAGRGHAVYASSGRVQDETLSGGW